MSTPTKALHDAGQSLWLDNITRTMLDEGELERLIGELGITGLTSNPSIFDKALAEGHAYDAQVRELHEQGMSDEEVFFEVAISDLRRACDLFMPAHRASAGFDGWVSLEVSPELAYDTEATIAQARSLHLRTDRSNLFVKIPGTPEGLPAIEAAIHAGIPINVTLLFDRDQYLAAADAYLRGLERRVADGLAPDVCSVASIFVSRWDGAVQDTAPEALRGKLGLAVCGRAFKAYRDLLRSERMLRLMNLGARPQRMLWASTSTKDPSLPDTLYVDGLFTPFTVNTMPDSTLHAVADHGALPERPLPADGVEAETVLDAYEQAGIDVDALAKELQSKGAEAFVKSWSGLLETIASKRAALAGAS
jgi:transaldolase